MTLARQWRGQQPFEETWFIEALVGPENAPTDELMGLWIRHVIDATANEAAIWAILSDRSGVRHAAREVVPLSTPPAPPSNGADAAGRSTPLFAAGPGRLDRTAAVGRVGDLAWDLRLDDRGLRHAHVPMWVRLAGVGRTYAPGIFDLRVNGTLEIGPPGRSKTFAVHHSPGILGHLWGGASRVRSWAWAHCNAFDREDLVFEGLSVTLDTPFGPMGPLTSVVLHADGHAYRFSRTRDLVRTWSRFDRSDRDGHWVFEARHDRQEHVLTGRITLDPRRSATVRYDGHAQGARSTDVFCTNTRFGSIRIVLRDPRRGVDIDLKSRECAFEIAGHAPAGPLCI